MGKSLSRYLTEEGIPMALYTYKKVYKQFVLMEMKIKTTNRYNYKPTKIVSSKKMTIAITGIVAKQQKFLFMLVGCKMAYQLYKAVWQFFEKLNVVLTYYLAISELCICPTDLEIYFHTKICMQMCTVALFIIAKNWKQPKCPSKMNNLWYIHITEYYLLIKRHDLSSHAKRWMNSKFLIPKEEEASLKRLHTLWFLLYNILGKAKVWK